MLVNCPLCKQILFQAFKHIQYQFAICLSCFRQLVIKFGKYQYERISVLLQNGNMKLAQVKKINQELHDYLSKKITSIKQIIQNNMIQEFFERLTSSKKSWISESSTNPSLTIQVQQPIEKPQAENINDPSQLTNQNKTSSKLNIFKTKILERGSNMIQKIRQSQRLQKQVQKIQGYKNKLKETGDSVYFKISKIGSQFKGIKSQLPSLKGAFQNVEIKEIFKSKFFKW